MLRVLGLITAWTMISAILMLAASLWLRRRTNEDGSRREQQERHDNQESSAPTKAPLARSQISPMPSNTPGVSRSQRTTMTGLAAVAAVIDLGELYWFGCTAHWLAVLAPAGAAFAASVIWRRTRPLVALTGACLGYLDEYLFGVLRAGAAGFVLKHDPATTLLDGIRAVARGEGFVSPGPTRRLITRVANDDTEPVRLPDDLTPPGNATCSVSSGKR
ncbi:hypothetical protein [Streptomyces sp. NPDC096311]|uniref:hypothetical protein n=1 Tax=Streptomyces sp. NPDC096311 TaxID=3366083 RepID=UPI003825EF85